mmetsp:Transcript_58037/g.161933  ORF Transcript_58037/g.161933 Transcript_58037/m.161933 type:complete len:159 (-) Transcript_58037:54-530(-)
MDDFSVMPGVRTVGDMVMKRDVRRSPGSSCISFANFTLAPNHNIPPRTLRIDAMTAKERAAAICVSGNELRAELEVLRSGTPVLVHAALERLKTHTVFEPRDELDEGRRGSKRIAGKRGQARAGGGLAKSAKSASMPTLQGRGQKSSLGQAGKALAKR